MIFLAFSPDNGSVNNGRLEQECAELGRIYDACPASSIVFLDDPFSTTSQTDAIELLHEYVGKMLQYQPSEEYFEYVLVTIRTLDAIQRRVFKASKINVNFYLCFDS